MVGLGETEQELLQTFADLRSVGVEVVTIGQYLQPSPYHLSVVRFVSPPEFAQYKAAADRKSTRLNSSHQIISYAVFCLKKKKKQKTPTPLATKPQAAQSRVTPTTLIPESATPH